MKKASLSMCAVVGLVFAMSTATLAADNWLGTWSLNVQKSKFGSGPAPRSQTVKFEASEEGLRLTSDTVDAQGRSAQGGYLAKFDGKDYPWKNNLSADTVAIRRIDDSSYESTWKKAGKVTITSKIVVSQEGKVLINTQTGKNVQGQDVNYTLIFEKQ